MSHIEREGTDLERPQLLQLDYSPVNSQEPPICAGARVDSGIISAVRYKSSKN
jgi:hypothetical protein